MEDFQPVILRVLAIGGSIAAVGFALLYIVFRSFAVEKKNSDDRSLRLVLTLLAFVLLSCIALFALSYRH